MTDLRTPAWRLVGLTRNVPGVLALSGDRLVFTTLCGDGFDLPLAAVADIVFPWYYFGGGVKLVASGEAYRFSFVRPDGAQHVPAGLVSHRHASGEDGWEVEPDLGELARGRRAGRAWRDALRHWRS